MAKISGKRKNLMDEDVDLVLEGESFMDMPVVTEDGANGEKGEEEQVNLNLYTPEVTIVKEIQPEHTSSEENTAETDESYLDKKYEDLRDELRGTTEDIEHPKNDNPNLVEEIKLKAGIKRKDLPELKPGKVQKLFNKILKEVDEKPSYVSAKISDNLDMEVEQAIITLRRKHNFKIDKRKFMEVGVRMLLKELDLDEIE